MVLQFRGRFAVYWLSIFLLFPSLSRTQQFTRQELGLGLQSQTASLFVNAAPSAFPDSIGPRHTFAGPFGRYTWNLSPSLALEGSLAYLPGYQTSFGADNGHELLSLAGVKAGWRRRRFGLYGKIEPGFASFSPGLNVQIYANQPDEYQRRTNFALDTGGVLELYPSARTILRFDVSQTLLAEYDQVLVRTSGFLDLHEAHLADHLGLAFSLAHRFGAFHDETERSPARQPIDIGVLYSLQQRVHLSFAQMQANSGAGAFLSWNFAPCLSLDTTAFYSPHKDGFIFPQDGGTTADAFAGFKAGIRRGRMGYFAKLRPGMIQFSRTVWLEDPAIHWEKTTDFALDSGGILEVYPSHHTLLRFEAGNTYIHYHAARIHLPQSQDLVYIPRRRSSITLLFGGGVRF
ncbi:MAG TPA: hypothetical protein VGG42_14380 [Acidobacteriaceae bacterium]